MSRRIWRRRKSRRRRIWGRGKEEDGEEVNGIEDLFLKHRLNSSLHVREEDER